MEDWILTIMVFFPVLGIIAVTLLPKAKHQLIKGISLVSTFVPLLGAGYLWANWEYTPDGETMADQFQFLVKIPWIQEFGIHYHLGVDGISMPMVMLTALISFIAVVASLKIKEGVKGYFAMYLLLHIGMMGVFVALDLFLFYVFWEIMLLPMYFLIGIWGGERRAYAAIKFFLYTLFGSIFLLLFVLVVYFQMEDMMIHGQEMNPFNMLHLLKYAEINGGILAGIAEVWRGLLFLGLFVAFAIKVPVFPFHTWLPDAHVEAPTPISVILAGILLKMGLYGIFRMNLGFFPDIVSNYTFIIAFLGFINLVYGGLCALAQSDFKKLVAYSSISHMGFCLLGIASGTEAGYIGALFVMIAHGVVSPLMFLSVGVVYDRTHHREIEGYGGLAQRMPMYFGFTALTFFAALGLPGLISFPGEVLTLIGAFQEYQIITILSLAGILIGASYCLWTIQRVFMGPLNPKYEEIPDLNLREYICLTPLALITVIFGVYPMPIIDLMSHSLKQLVSIVA